MSITRRGPGARPPSRPGLLAGQARRDVLALGAAAVGATLVGCGKSGSGQGEGIGLGGRQFVDPTTAAEYLSTMHLGTQAANYLEMAYEPAGVPNAVGAADFDTMVGQGGFDHLRIPACCPARADVTGLISEAFLTELDNQIALALAVFARVIVDPLHHYNQWKGGHTYDPAYDDYVRVARLTADEHAVRATAMWTQLAVRYRDTSSRLSFDLFNEPSQTQEAGYPPGLDSRQLDAWHAAVIPAIRATGGVNATRMVWLEPFTNRLELLALPANAGPIGVSPHSYMPFPFTLGPDALTAGGMANYAEDVRYMHAWGVAHGVPVWVGESGSSLDNSAGAPRSADDRAEFAAHIRNSGRAAGVPVSYWAYNSDFALFDQLAKQWKPSMQQAVSALPQPLPTRTVPAFITLAGGRLAKLFDPAWAGFSYDAATGILSAPANDSGQDQSVVVVFQAIGVAGGQAWITRATSFTGFWTLGYSAFAYDAALPNRQGVAGLDVRAQDSQGNALYPYRVAAPGGNQQLFGSIATAGVFFAADVLFLAGSPAGQIVMACVQAV